MMLSLLVSFGALGTLTGVLAVQGSGHHECRCLPSQPCWPSQHEWSALNRSLDGNLAGVTPIGKVCHGINFDQARCAEVNAMASNSSWRSDQPGAGQWGNWEAWPLHNESCYVDSDRRVPCQQGRVSLYSAAVTSAKHIQAATRFAARHNIRLAVKNTGHDFAGRSLAPLSLQIFTHRMKDITFAEKFTPNGFHGNKKNLGPAVTVAAGVQLQQLYKFCAEKNVSVVAGFSSTVGAAGGYIQGGGHSILGPWKGLASDHALQFSVVTADGSIVIANEYQNQDLFWALRGGGGGTFGVVTSVTLRAHTNPPIVATSLNIIRAVADEKFWELIERLYEQLPTLNDFGASGVHVIFPQMPVAPTNSTPGGFQALMTIQFLFANQPSAEAVRTALSPLEAAFRNSSDNNTHSDPADFQFSTTAFPTLSEFYTTTLTGVDRGGALTAMGSHLVSRAFIASASGPRTVADTFSRLRLAPGEAVSGNVVAGGAVARNSDISSAVNPAWRRTLSHMSIIRGWSANATLAEQAQVQKDLTEEMIPALKKLRLADEPEMGSYLNEADAYEPEFQKSFWGLENYRRLYTIKKKWDPKGLFIVRRGVGSEDWDDDGLCRVRSCGGGRA